MAPRTRIAETLVSDSGGFGRARLDHVRHWTKVMQKI